MTRPTYEPHALAELYKRLGFAICWTSSKEGEAAKRCTTPDWPHAARRVKTGDADELAEQLETSNPVAVLRASGLIGVECDGKDELELFESFGAPPTLSVQSSGRYKRHFYFAPPGSGPKPAGRRKRIDGCEFVGFRFEDGSITADRERYFVLPPARHPSGKSYRFLDDGAEIAELPLEVYEALVTAAGKAKQREVREVFEASGERIPQGRRHDFLVSRIGTFCRAGLSEEAILAAMLEENQQRCDPPKQDAEVEDLVRRQYARWVSDDWQPRNPDGEARPARSRARGAAPVTSGGPEADEVPDDPFAGLDEETEPSALERLRAGGVVRATVTFADKKIAPVKWLPGFEYFLQSSCFVLAAGKKNTYKTTFDCWLAAQFSLGAFSEDGEPQHAVMIASEDSIQQDLLPRVAVAGGDLRYVHKLDWNPRLPNDIPDIIETTLDLVGDKDALGMLSINPVANHIGDTDSNSEMIRATIAPLNELADVDALDCMIVCYRHLRKDISGGALAAVLGNTAWVDTPRQVLGFAVEDARDEDDEDEGRIVTVSVLASNRGPANINHCFRVQSVQADEDLFEESASEEERERPFARLMPMGTSKRSVDEVLGDIGKTRDKRESRSQQARELILAIVEEEGEVLNYDLEERVAKEVGVTKKTVKNLRFELKDEGLLRFRPTNEHNVYWVVPADTDRPDWWNR